MLCSVLQYCLEFLLCFFAGLIIARSIAPWKTYHFDYEFWFDRMLSVIGVISGLLLIAGICYQLIGILMPIRIAIFTLFGTLAEVIIRYLDYSLRDD